MSSYSTFRKTGIVGEYEIDNILETSSIHFSEWHNGEGLDFTVFNKSLNTTDRFSLTIEQLNALAVIGEAIGYIEMDDVKREAEQFIRNSEQRRRNIEQIRKKYNQTSGLGSKLGTQSRNNFEKDDIDRFDSDVPF